jgi:para-nitrobenzyl esterase
MAERLGVAPTREGIASADPLRLRAAQAQLGLEVAMTPDPARWGRLALDLMPFEPTIDGDVVPALPFDAVTCGAGSDVPLLTGITTEEWRLFLVPPGLIDMLGEREAALALAAYGAADPAVAAVYQALGGSPGDRLCAITTDWFLRIPAIRLGEARAGAPATTHLYEFAWRSPAFDGRLGACHALELPFLFDTLATRSGRAFAGDDPPREVGDRMRAAWVAFAQAGDPGWPPYDAGDRPVMVFDEHSVVAADPHLERRAAWDGRR